MTITSIGYGDIAATPHNSGEQAICTTLMILGGIIWGYVIGTFCGTIANLSPATREFRHNMDDLNTYMAANHFDSSLQARLREYFFRARHIYDASNQSRLLSMMSPALQSEAVLMANSKWLRSVWFLSSENVEQEFVVCLTLGLTPMVLAPFELAPFGFLYILYRGVVINGGELLTKGCTWGEDIILKGFAAGLLRPMHAKSMDFAAVYIISWDGLMDAAANFPVSASHIRRCALRLAMRRQLVRAAAAIKRAERAGRSPPQFSAEGGEFFQRSASRQEAARQKTHVKQMLTLSTSATDASAILQTQLINQRRASMSSGNLTESLGALASPQQVPNEELPNVIGRAKTTGSLLLAPAPSEEAGERGALPRRASNTVRFALPDDAKVGLPTKSSNTLQDSKRTAVEDAMPIEAVPEQGLRASLDTLNATVASQAATIQALSSDLRELAAAFRATHSDRTTASALASAPSYSA
uniref:Cyclic nucleotide-binding domain-containing protein n=1 Tax=Haptolina brevifila TaxID=156173 RepID=A0A7S2MDU8_9EUKA